MKLIEEPVLVSERIQRFSELKNNNKMHLDVLNHGWGGGTGFSLKLENTFGIFVQRHKGQILCSQVVLSIFFFLLLSFVVSFKLLCYPSILYNY